MLGSLLLGLRKTALIGTENYPKIYPRHPIKKSKGQSEQKQRY